MSGVLNALYVVGFAISCIGAVVSWFIAVINMFRAVAGRKPGVPLFSHWWESPFNIVFRPAQLTETGLSARRWCGYGVAGFFVSWCLAALIGLITGIAELFW